MNDGSADAAFVQHDLVFASGDLPYKAADVLRVVADADLERFLAATGHVPRILDVPGATASAAEDAAA